MKIAIIATYTTDHFVGGREIHVKELSEGLAKRGHEVTIFTTKHPMGIKHEIKNDVNIYYYDKNNPKIYRASFFKDFSDFFQKMNKGKKFDVVHNQQTLLGYSFIKYHKNNIPLVTTLHGTTENEIKSALNTKSIKGLIIATHLIFRSFYCPVDKITLNNADKIIAVSTELGEDIKKQYRLPEGKLAIILNGIDVNRFKPMSAGGIRKKWALNYEKIILSVGAINEQKGFHLLLKVLPDILEYDKKIKLVIVGTGPYLSKLKNIANKLNISESVIFTGRVSDDDLPRYYNLADIFVNLTMRLEGLPLVIIEAMACEKPVVASAIGGIKDVIEDGVSGILVAPGNINALKGNIIKVLGDEQLAHEFGKNARKRVVERFSLDRMVEDTIKVYEEVLEDERYNDC